MSEEQDLPENPSEKPADSVREGPWRRFLSWFRVRHRDLTPLEGSLLRAKRRLLAAIEERDADLRSRAYNEELLKSQLRLKEEEIKTLTEQNVNLRKTIEADTVIQVNRLVLAEMELAKLKGGGHLPVGY
jgi:hypothetical protein